MKKLKEMWKENPWKILAIAGGGVIVVNTLLLLRTETEKRTFEFLATGLLAALREGATVIFDDDGNVVDILDPEVVDTAA